MPASRFSKYTGRNWPNPVCSFYLPVSTSRDDPVAKGHESTGNAVRALKFCRKRRMGTSSSFCDGMGTTVTAAHHFIWRYLYASMQAAQTPASKLRFVTRDKETRSSMNTLWQEEKFEQICSRESLMAKAADIERTISVKEHERERYDFDPTMSRFYEDRLSNWRPDGIVINKNH